MTICILNMSIIPQVQFVTSGNNVAHTPSLQPWLPNTVQPNMMFVCPDTGIVYAVATASTPPRLILPPSNHDTDTAKAAAKEAQKTQDVTDRKRVNKLPYHITPKQPQNPMLSTGDKRTSSQKTTENKREKTEPPIIELMKPHFEYTYIPAKTKMENTPCDTYEQEVSEVSSHVSRLEITEHSKLRTYTFKFEVNTYRQKSTSLKYLQILVHALLANDNNPMTNSQICDWIATLHEAKPKERRRNLISGIKSVPKLYPNIVAKTKVNIGDFEADLYSLKTKFNEGDVPPVKSLAVPNMLPNAAPPPSTFAAMAASSYFVPAPVTVTVTVPATSGLLLAATYNLLGKQQN